MILYDFTTPELKYFEEHCNFVGMEKIVFDLRSQGKSLEQIAYLLDLSIDKTKKLSQKINRKILKVL